MDQEAEDKGVVLRTNESPEELAPIKDAPAAPFGTSPDGASRRWSPR
jgi:hypothetical protein